MDGWMDGWKDGWMDIKMLNYFTNALTRFCASAPSSGSFDIAFASVIKY
jgi:hypothetical protein